MPQDIPMNSTSFFPAQTCLENLEHFQKLSMFNCVITIVFVKASITISIII